MKQLNQIVLGVFLLFTLNVSCKKNMQSATLITKQKEAKKNSDTIITKSGIYMVYPNEKEIDSLKKAIGESDFYTMADDNNYYMAEISSKLKGKVIYVKQPNINFEKEQFLFSKKNNVNSWLVIDYEEGGKPQIYSLVDYYMKLSKNSNVTSPNANIDSYLKNDDFFSISFDINGDGKDDKVFSNKPNTGDSLLVFFNDNNGYALKLKSTNFSQDGGNQISEIKKNGNGFSVETDFPKGTNKYIYFVSYQNNNFIVSKVIHEVESWQDNKAQICTFHPGVSLQRSNDEIFSALVDSEKKAECVNKRQ
ncbi:hypothetical protein [Chryseobacterium gossypii]|uniref:hypothetical protein n=1 Tax=Chryseobacterium gossypii TaxID=3231602 RepID=UPI0035236761